jgi:hypothetical protein
MPRAILFRNCLLRHQAKHWSFSFSAAKVPSLSSLAVLAFPFAGTTVANAVAEGCGKKTAPWEKSRPKAPSTIHTDRHCFNKFQETYNEND